MIWNIPASYSFSDVLVNYLAEKYTGFSLAQITLILPSRRAVKSVRDAFMKKATKTTFLLPKLISLYDIEEVVLDIPPAIDETERIFMLLRLIRQKQDMSYAKAFELAQDLARFIDELETYDVSFDALKKLPPDEFAQHWKQTLSFLEIIGEFYPQILKEKGKTSPALYRKKLLEEKIKQWKENPPLYPIIAAGFNGGLPTINRFLKEINELDNSEIILPYLDKNISTEDWKKLDETHPQYMLRTLLKELNVTAQEVISLTKDCAPRQQLATEMMTPVSSTHTWQNKAEGSFKGTEQIKYFISSTPDEEALSIALSLREALETPNKTAALISPDRKLAKRVIAHMKRWNVLLDDSGGTSLDLTPIGRFFLQLAEVAVSQNIPDLLALLKHPLSANGKSPVLFRKEIQILEKEYRKKQKAFEPDLPEELHQFFNLFTNSVSVPFDELIRCHISASEALATSDDRTAEERLWSKEEGIVLSELLANLIKQTIHIPFIDVIEYPSFLKALMRTKNIRPKHGMHPRLDILGVMESRLQSPDLVIIGGLNEGCFPEKTQDDLWLSRLMRKQLGLPLPEEKIGIAANDFIHAFMAKEVILSRSLKEGTTPTIPSRWLLRMETLLKSSKQDIFPQKHPYLEALRPFLDTVPCERPSPCPPLSSRPNKMSLTSIERWMQDPYGIYACKILNLEKLNDLNGIDKAAYGTAVHSILSEFINLPPHLRTRKKIDELAQISFEKNNVTEQQLAFIRPRFDKAMDWIVNNQPTGTVFTEKDATLELPFETENFKIYGRADRIDLTEHGAVIIDYKTGSHPKKSNVQQGYAPQLPLEAFLLENGAFKEIGKAKTAQMSYIRLSGKQEGVEITSVTDKKTSPEILIKKTHENLIHLINLFRQKDTPYSACPLKNVQPTYNDYAHLERLAEWQNSIDGNDTNE